jgi:hypothetical protein
MSFAVPTKRLSNNTEMPVIGLGTYGVSVNVLVIFA